MKKIGVLLTNLGTPDAPTSKALRIYLREFLSDRRVITLSPLLWQPILNGIILTTRPRIKAKDYKKIWTEHGSPLLHITQQQQHKLQFVLKLVYGDNIEVLCAMRYGNPSIAASLKTFAKKNIEKICVLPLYPQYSAATTASTFDKIAEVLKGQQNIPEIRLIKSYYDAPAYIKALAESINNAWAAKAKADKLIFSFHGLPQEFVDQGDPYQQQCLTTAKLVAAHLQLEAQEWMVTFQSRFGPKQWLQPYTDMTLKELPKQGIKTVDIICPGFAADCLETLEEIQEENKGYFLAAGGKDLRYIPALNASSAHVAMMSQLIQANIQGWV
ncbi:MAG: ferrochelatase [Pseudomonadota bacterium]